MERFTMAQSSGIIFLLFEGKLHEFSILKNPGRCIPVGLLNSLNTCSQVLLANLSTFLWQVGWDESTAGERPSRVSIWDIEPVVTPFFICPPPFFRPKFPKQPGLIG